MRARALQSCPTPWETLWTAARQAPLSMGFSRQEPWSGLPCPPPGDLPDPGIEPTSLKPPASAGRFSLPLAPPGKPLGSGAWHSNPAFPLCSCGIWGFCFSICANLSLEGWLGGLSEGVRGSVCLQAGFQNLLAFDDGPAGGGGGPRHGSGVR